MRATRLSDLDRRVVETAYARWAPVYDKVCGPIFETGRRTATSAALRPGWFAKSRTHGACLNCAAAGATGRRSVITPDGTTVIARGKRRFSNSRGACGLLNAFVITVTFETLLILQLNNLVGAC